jgi:hypothetical protein
MLTQLSTLKFRLGITEADTTQDPLLLAFLRACGASFDHECGRRLAHTENLIEEFTADELEICLASYPVESVGKFELKSFESSSWVEQPAVRFNVRHSCILSLESALGDCDQVARVMYTGGYVEPGTVPASGQEALPADLEQAAIEQVAAWFANRDKVGLMRNWPTNGTFQVLSQLPLLPWVRQVLKTHQRWNF